MLDTFGFPTPQGSNYQEFYGGGTTRDWIKPRGASMVRMLLIGAGGGGSGGSTGTNGVNGGGSGAVTEWIGPVIFIPDVLRITTGLGGAGSTGSATTTAVAGTAGTASSVIYQAKNGTGYTLLTANGGGGGGATTAPGTAGTVMTNNYFGASGIFNAVAGQAGSRTTVAASTTVFVSGGAGGANLAAGLASTGATAGGMASGAEALGTTPEALGTVEGMTNALSSPSTYVGEDAMYSTMTDPNKVQTFADAYTKGAAPADTFMGQANQMGAGIKQAFQPGGGTALYNALDTGTLPALGVTAANLASPEIKPPTETGTEVEEKYKKAPYSYGLSSNFSGYVPRQPQPYYRPTGLGYAAGGDIMLAGGGSYDDEPMGDNPGMASGGITGYAAGGLKIGEGIARDTDDDTASLGAFDAAKKRISKINKAANMPKNYAAKMAEVRGLGELAAAQGGSIGGYSDGGRMLKGPGDGMSDSIPATIGKRQPARLADGEFVVPADVVSHLGNGSTDAGAKRLYGMMDKVRQARKGKKKQAREIKAEKYMPA